MFGQNFTLVGQQQFVQLGHGQEGQANQQGDDGLQRVCQTLMAIFSLLIVMLKKE